MDDKLRKALDIRNDLFTVLKDWSVKHNLEINTEDGCLDVESIIDQFEYWNEESIS
jgi:hypothetical protein